MVLYGLDCSNMRWLSDIIAASFMGIVFQNLFFFFFLLKKIYYTQTCFTALLTAVFHQEWVVNLICFSQFHSEIASNPAAMVLYKQNPTCRICL